MNDNQMKELPMLFEESIKAAVDRAKEFSEVNVVIGIPFNDEKDLLPEVLRVVDDGLAGLQELSKSLIVCVGDPTGAKTLEAIQRLVLNAPHLEFLMQPGCSGRGNAIRAILEIAHTFEADAVILAADLVTDGDRGLQPNWVRRLIEPIRREYDFVVTSFQRHYFEDLLGNLFLAPMLEAFYGYNVKGSLGGIYAIAHDTVEDICADIKFWTGITEGAGIDPWLVSRVICWHKKLCEVELGARLEESSLEQLNTVFKENAKSLFECIKRDADYCSSSRSIIRTPDVYAGEIHEIHGNPNYSIRDLKLFRDLYVHQKDFYGAASYDSIYDLIGDIAPVRNQEFKITEKTWAEVVYRLLFRYWFVNDASRDDLLDALTFAFNGRIYSFIDTVQSAAEKLENIGEIAAAVEQKKAFLRLRELFMLLWEQWDLELKPPLNPANYLEFIPGVPTALNKKIEGLGGKEVSSEELLSRLQSRYQLAFSSFIKDGLGVPENADSNMIVGSMQKFLGELEKTMDFLFPGDLYTVEGTEQVVDGLIRIFHSPLTLAVKDEVLLEVMLRFPPLNVMIAAGCKTPRELMGKMSVREAFSLANLVEGSKYAERCLRWTMDVLTPEGMGETAIKLIVLSDKVLDGTVRIGSVSDYNKLTARVVVRPLKLGTGGDYPKLRFVLFVARHIAIAKNYSILWRVYAKERKNLGVKIRNSLAGNYDTIAFSAHKVFENAHHRVLVSQFREVAAGLAEAGRPDQARLISIMCDGYGLSQVLADGTFLPCSAWSWASFSYKGGRGVPTPVFSHVEETWFNRDFLKEIYQGLGYDPAEITEIVTQLIGADKGSENLLNILLGIKQKDLTVVVQEPHYYPPTIPLVRYAGNPLLSPIKEHSWESRYVLNSAAFRVKDRVYLLYRGHGDDGVSRIGLAVTDGFNVLERLPEPIFVPQNRAEEKGVEDPRVVIIDNVIRMLYTAYDGVTAQIAAAHIGLDDFLNRRFDKWERDGLVFQGIWDKDAVLFPEKIKGKYIVYHRIDPSIWMLAVDKISLPFPKTGHSIIFGPRSGWMWDSLKVGAGAQPIKTRYGWLLIYHGVDRNKVYRLGVILVDLDDPERLLYRSPNPVLSPETEYEIGKKGESWVPNVVFTCGAVPAQDKEVLDAGDEVLVYYGAADTHMCIATGKVGDMIPESIRQEVDGRQ